MNNSTSILSRLLSVPYCKRPCCGSSHGWLIFAQDTLSLTLFNPFTAATIHLPPLLTPKQLREVKDIYQYYFYHEYEIIKVALSDDPSSNNNYEVLALQFHGRLALFTSRGGRWIYGENYFDYLGCLMEINLMRNDIIYFNGKFHALIDRKLGSVEIYNLDEKPYIRLEPLKGLVDDIVNIMTRPIEDPDVIWCTYIAESIAGTLIYVERFTIRRFGSYLPWCYRVYELEEEEANGIKKFIPLAGNFKGLGDQALFLGYNQSVSVRASDFPGCKPNSIYFTDDETCNKLGQMYLGVYTLGRDELHNSSLYKLDPSHTHLPPPIWIVPQPNLAL